MSNSYINYYQLNITDSQPQNVRSLSRNAVFIETDKGTDSG
jgi:hypothetical protein